MNGRFTVAQCASMTHEEVNHYLSVGCVEGVSLLELSSVYEELNDQQRHQICMLEEEISELNGKISELHDELAVAERRAEVIEV